MKGENSNIRKLAGAAMVLVTAATVFMVSDFKNQAQATGSQGRIQEDTEALQGLEGTSYEMTEADYAAVQAYARNYAGEWNVEMYFDGEEWKIYEFGKRMAIIAYNFLNDGSYTTGGYKRIVGHKQQKEVRNCRKIKCTI